MKCFGKDGIDMLIMKQDNPICEINLKTGPTRFCELPPALYLEQGMDLDTCVMNLMNFQAWCAGRLLSLDREHAKAILNSCGLAQAVTDKDRMNVALKYHCLSLKDFYWVQGEEEGLSWNKVNLFDNSLNNIFVDTALFGKGITVENLLLAAPDCATAGVFPKAWVRKNTGFLLYKSSDAITDGVRKEVEASQMLQRLGLSVLNYEYVWYDDTEVSACQCYTGKDCSYAEAGEIADSIGLPVPDKVYYTMLLADYLIGNSDRHRGNWGFLYNTDLNLTDL